MKRPAPWPYLVAGLALVTGCLFFLLLRGGHRFAPRPSPNVLLVSIDTLRADHLGTYGAKVATPTLDRLASEGVLFEQAVSHVPLTLPSHTSLLTGTYPIAHGVRDNAGFRLAPTRPTLATIFREHGYRTGAFVGSFPLDSRFGLDHGFEVYDDAYGEASAYDVKIVERRAEEVLKPAAAWIEARAGERYFAFVHLYDPHAPYEPPPPFAERFRSDPYTGEIVYADGALGQFFSRLAAAGQMENTIVVITADHGEGLGEHGEKTHGMFAYDATLHVPLIFHWKDALPAGARIAARVRLIDVAPTLVALAGLPASPGFQGESLLAAISNPGAASDRESYFEALSFNLSRSWPPLTGLYLGSFKFIQLPILELYDLRADPGETRNLVESSPGRTAQMEKALAELVSARGSNESQAEAKAAPDAETVARLKTLGYVVAATGLAPAPSQYTAEDDPKRLVPLADKLDEGTNVRIAGHPEEAIRIYREILRERPGFTRAHVLLARTLRDTGRLSEAIAVLQHALRQGQRTASILAMLGWCLEEAGRAREAVVMLELALEQEPGNVEAWNSLALAHARLGERQRALEALDRLLAIDPSFASAYVNRGSVYLEEKKYPEAEESFRRALEHDERLAAAWNGLGVACGGAGRDAEAIAAWKRAVELDSQQFDAILNLALLLRRLHREAEEAVYLQQFVRTAPEGQYQLERSRARVRLGQLGRASF